MTVDDSIHQGDAAAGQRGALDVSAAQLEEEEQELRSSVAALETLATGRLELIDLLTAVATFAVRAIPGADGAGLTLLEGDRSDTVVTTADFVREVDNIQYGIGQGPCITAAEEGQTVLSGSLGGDPRWRKFGGQVARLGVHSVVSLPLITAGQVVGALNVYAHAKHAFDQRAADLGELFAQPAAIAVRNAQTLDQTRRLAIRLQVALETRGVLDRAVGILISRSGLTAEEALQRLRVLSQQEHTKLVVVAQRIVDEATRRVRARRADHG